MVKDINSGSGGSSPSTSQPLATPSISEPTTEPTERIVEERWNSLRHGDGQGHQQRKWQQFSHYLTAVGNTLYFRADDGTNGYELWKSDGTASWHGDGQGHQQRK